MSGAMNPEAAAIARRRALADRLMSQATQQDFRHPLSIGATIAQSLAGALTGYRADQDEEARATRQREERQAILGPLLGAMGGGGGEGAAPAAPSAPAAPITAPRPSGGGISPAVAPDDLMPHIQAAAQETGIPAALLVAKLRQESNFDPNARGRAGEIGLAQIMPATARQPGFGVQPVDPARLSDPRENILFGARYLAGRGRAAGVTDWNDPAQQDRALAAYNGGGDPNYVANVRRWLPQGDTVQASTQMPGGQMPAPGGQTAQPPRQPDQSAAMRGLILQAAMSDDPQLQRLAPMIAQMTAREDRTQTVAPGSFIMRNGQIVGQVPAAPPQPSEIERTVLPRWRELTALGERATPQQVAERDILARRLAGSGTSVNVNTDLRAEQAEAQGRGRTLAEEGERIRIAAETAAGTLDSIRQVRALGANTDRLAPLRETIGGYLDAMGVSPANSRLVREATTLQAFNAAANNVVLGRQLEQRGVQTEGDREVMRQTFATITNTNEANDAILRAVEAQGTRAMERAEFYQNWRQQPGPDGRPRNTLDGAAEAWNRYIRETPMVARTRAGIVFLNEWLPEATRDFNGDQEAALRLWRERARQR